MRGRTLLMLLVVAAVAVGAALFTSRKQPLAAPDVIGRELLPDLDVNAVASITVVSATDTTTVARIDGTWQCPALYGYPADFEKIRDALLKLEDLTIAQLMRGGAQQPADLGIVSPRAADEADPDTVGTLIELRDDRNRVVADCLIGDTHTRRTDTPSPMYGPQTDGQYISVDGGETVYLVTTTLDEFPVDPKQWADAEILNVSASSLTSVTIDGPDREPLTLLKENGTLTLPDLAENEELDTSKKGSLDSALSWLRFSSIADPALTEKETGLDSPDTYTAVTATGQVYTVRIGGTVPDSEKRYVRIGVALAPEPAQDTDAGDETDAEADDAAAAQQRLALEAETAGLNAKLSGWVFVLETYKTDAMTMGRDDLVKQKEAEEEAEPETDAAEPESGGDETMTDASDANDAEPEPPAPEAAATARETAPPLHAEQTPKAPATLPTAPVAKAAADVAAEDK